MSEIRLPRQSIARVAGPVTGVGVRSGLDVTVRLLPAKPGQGLVIRRTDVDAMVPLDLAHALDLPNCTAVGTGPETATLFVEHLMAVLHVHRVTDLTVEVSGPEIPLLDGSAKQWDELIRQVGVTPIGGEIAPVVVGEQLRVEDGDKHITASPGPPNWFMYDLYYDHPMIGHQVVTTGARADDFAADIAPARTFAPVEELEQLMTAGLLKAGDETNCLVIYPDHYSAEPTLENAFAAHKIMDMLGDLYLLGRPVLGQFSGFRTGHAHNRALLGKIAGYNQM